MTGIFASERRLSAYRLAIAAFLWLALMVAGGASRADEWQQAGVRLAAILCIVLALWPLDMQPIRRNGVMFAALALAWLVPMAQLVPLPAPLWAALPGHEVYGRIAQATGHVLWRPLSLAPDFTLESMLALLPVTASLLAAAGLDGRGRRHVAMLVAAIALASALLGLAQVGSGGVGLRLFQQSSQDAPVGIFANRNHQAALLACGLPFVAVMAVQGIRRNMDQRAVLLGALMAGLFLLFVLVLTGSRAGLVLALMGLTGSAAILNGAGLRLRRGPMTWLIGAGGALAALAFVAVAAWRGGAFERLAATDTVDETRFLILRPLVHVAQVFMPWGSGFGTFDRVYRQFEPDSLLSNIYLNAAHDEPLQLAIEGGVPALALLVLFLLWWGRQAGRALFGAVSPRGRAMQLACLTVTVILMAASLVDYPLRTPLLGSLFVFACLELAQKPVPERKSARP